MLAVINRSLDDWGMNFLKDHPYELRVWAKADQPTQLFVALENQTADKTLAEDSATVTPDGWKCYNFTLTPTDTDHRRVLAVLAYLGV